jgi:GTP 3',8-cyclase
VADHTFAPAFKRGVNDRHVVDMARYFKGSGSIVRFIEFMDVGATNGWKMDDVIPGAEVVKRIHEGVSLRTRRPQLLR